ncbi:MAG: DUF1553 domain-containing protein, partial [Planctomycetales bacterium]
ATRDQLVASGFNRNHMINFEGGAIPEEYHTAYIVDRVNTTGTIWLGMSVGCAQCHDHKYDPISQRDFYGLFAFFHNVPENGLDGSKGNAAPLLRIPSDDEQRQLNEMATAIAGLEQKIAGDWPESDAAQVAWERTAAERPAWSVLQPSALQARGGAKFARQEDGAFLVTGENPAADSYEVTAPIDLPAITGVRLEALPDNSLPARGPGRSANGNLVLTDVRVARLNADPDAAPVPLKLRAASASFSQADFPVAKAIDGDSKSGWAIFPRVGEPHTAIFELEEPLRLERPQRLRVTLEFQSQFSQHQIGKFRLSITSANDPHGTAGIPDNVTQALAIPSKERDASQLAAVRAHFRSQVFPEGRQLHAEIDRLKKAHAGMDQSIGTTMVMQEMDRPRDTFLLIRGQYDKKGDQVRPAVPAALTPLPPQAPANRLGLAQWLVSPEHPLTARVTVNRFWQSLFGTGLVKTAEDFGSQGELPSHPELLDWLAVEFMSGQSAWDVKALVRLIVTSAAYQQSSVVSRDLLARDPENRLLARGPRFRLQAEFIRDQALAVSGLLDRRIGGKSVSPYQPAGLWEELMSRADGKNWTAQSYEQSHGPDLYRRTMYTFWKRTCPPPTLATFDAPDRETCTVRRARTNTPLQALVLLNDPTYVESARKFGERILREGGKTTDERLAFAFRAVLVRDPAPRELAVLRRMLEGELTRYRHHPEAAAKVLAVGEAPRDESLDQAELAAWTTIASAILNLDETVTRG